ncbi:adenylyl cyclase-associated protein 1-like [Saccoglossus kowalevskii]|uniref:Adenylyl cyclase-associated protein n=1 Tax=Saccoglossus kowalevskii TaxID=10224 RepID=A0ABM0MFY3_SACKO|nr:PREDICTED: adenylyl cyclase-associated protein 1-like [Saccoglossus kowalevskii]
MSSGELSDLVRRLEDVTTRLESVSLKTTGDVAVVDSPGINESINNIAKRLQNVAGGESKGVSGKASVASVEAYDDLISGSLDVYLKLSADIGGEVKEHSVMVAAAFKTQRDFVVQVSKCKEPKQEIFLGMLQPMSNHIQAIQQYREKNRASKMFNHLSAVSEGIPALGWVATAPKPAPYVKEMSDAAQFYTNRVLKDYKETDKRHIEWAKSFLKIITDLHVYVKTHHITGLSWNAKGEDATGPVAASTTSVGAGPPPPPPPPPADFATSSGGAADAADDSKIRSALFSDLNKGSDITSGLKKVTPDMQTHKNPALKKQQKGYFKGPTPYKAPTHSSVQPPSREKVPPPVAKKPAAKKPPKLELSGSKWEVEFHEGNKNIVIETTAIKQVVYIYKCNDCTIQIKGKLNSITLDSCKKTGLAFDSLVSTLDLVNCQSIQAQVRPLVNCLNLVLI